MSDSEKIEKIKQYLLANQQYPLEQLSAQLINAGATQEEIKQAILELRSGMNKSPGMSLGKIFMITIAILVIGGGFVIIFNKGNESGANFKSGDDKIIIEDDSNYIEMEKAGIFGGEYRVLGITEMTTEEDNPFGPLDYMIFIAPVDKVREIWARDNCEKGVQPYTESIQLIINDKDLDEQFREATKIMQGHFSLKLIGYEYKKTVHKYEGKSILDDSRYHIKTNAKIDHNKYIVLKSFEEIEF